MLLSELILHSNLTSLGLHIPEMLSLPRILERISSDAALETDKIVAALKSPEILLQKGESYGGGIKIVKKRDIMENIVAQYSTVFGTKSRPGK